MKVLQFLILCGMLAANISLAYAGVVKPYTFSAGTQASASQVNANFDILYSALNQGGAFPIGGIILWSGSSTNIPIGWALCNGANGTPDLRDRFIVGAGGGYSVGGQGGSSSNNLTHSHTVNNHSHHMDFSFGRGYITDDIKDGAVDGDKDVGSDEHGHHIVGDTQGAAPGTSASLSSVDNRPPYYALCFIMKLP